MANLHAVVRTDNMAGTDVGTHLESVRYMGAGTTPTAIENGNVVLLNGLLSKTVGSATVIEREIYKGVTPAKNSNLKDIVLVATPEVFYDERLHNLDSFINEAGRVIRGYHLHTQDEFGVTIEALNFDNEYTPVVGSVVELMAGTQLNVVAELSSGATQVGVINRIETAGRYTYYVIRVV